MYFVIKLDARKANDVMAGLIQADFHFITTNACVICESEQTYIQHYESFLFNTHTNKKQAVRLVLKKGFINVELCCMLNE